MIILFYSNRQQQKDALFLNGDLTRDESWPKNAQVFPSACFMGLICQHLHKRFFIFQLPQILAPQGATMSVHSLPMKSRKRSAHDIFATQAGLVHDITIADCWAQNGSARGHVFPYFQTSIFKFNKHDKKLCAKLVCVGF